MNFINLYRQYPHQLDILRSYHINDYSGSLCQFNYMTFSNDILFVDQIIGSKFNETLYAASLQDEHAKVKVEVETSTMNTVYLQQCSHI